MGVASLLIKLFVPILCHTIYNVSPVFICFLEGFRWFRRRALALSYQINMERAFVACQVYDDAVPHTLSGPESGRP